MDGARISSSCERHALPWQPVSLHAASPRPPWTATYATTLPPDPLSLSIALSGVASFTRTHSADVLGRKFSPRVFIMLLKWDIVSGLDRMGAIVETIFKMDKRKRSI